MSIRLKKWTFWVKDPDLIVDEKEADIKITARFRMLVTKEEAKKLLKLRGDVHE